MTEYCQHKMKNGKRKGRPCLEDADRTADGSHAVKDGTAVFCHNHAPPEPPPMLDVVLDDLEADVRSTIKALADVPDDMLLAAIKENKKKTRLVNNDTAVVWFGLEDALDELKKRLGIKQLTGDDHHDMRDGVRVKGSTDRLWQEITS